jgi:hypothetical protein
LRVIDVEILFIYSTSLVPTLLTCLDVSGDAEKHVFTKLSHVDGLVALVDDIGVAFPSLVRVSHGFMAHPCIKLLSTLLGGGLFQLEYLFREEVLEELVIVADFEELGRPPLVVVEHDLKLRDSFAAQFADPVVDFLVGAVLGCSIAGRAIFKDFSCPSETLHQGLLVLSGAVEKGQRLG